MKKILVAFVIAMFSTAAFAAEGTANTQTGKNDSSVVHKAKKKKKGKKGKKKKHAEAPAESTPPAGDAGAPPAGDAGAPPAGDAAH